jgi:hypothetical protein
MIGMETVCPLYPVSVDALVNLQGVGGMDPPDHQGLAFQLDLAGDIGPETTASGRDASRFERTPEGADQSATRRRDEVVDRGRIQGEVLLLDAIVLRDGTVDPERDRLFAAGKPCGSLRSPVPHDRHLRRVCDITHGRSHPV